MLIDLDATEPEPDDTIRLTAAVGSTDKVMIRLSNRFLGYSTFQAYFTAKSSPHFTVSPSSGVLAPFGVDGTPFIITYSPLKYASRELATLIVTTDDIQWSYEVIGQYPGRTLMPILSYIAINTSSHNLCMHLTTHLLNIPAYTYQHSSSYHTELAIDMDTVKSKTISKR